MRRARRTFAAARVEIFKSDGDASGNGEGRTYLGVLTADGSGNFSGTLTVTDLALGDKITGTATDGSNNTSEFGGNLTVTGPITGTVFEDANYGGGAGRDRATSSGVVRSAARVELYDNAGAFLTSTTTDGSGNYSFASVTAGNYTVRVVNSTVTSSRTGHVAGTHLPVQTYRTNASSGTAVAVTDRVGGQTPSVADAGNGAAGCTLNTTTGAFTSGSCSGTAQSIANVTLGTPGVSGVDFGFNFDTIVNTNDTGQGSLRQFLTNANALSNAGLAQSGRTAGIDNAVFMLADGTARPGMNAGYASQFTGGVATIAPGSALPTISEPVILDGQTQPGWSSAPIIELNGTGAGSGVHGLTITAGGSTVRGFAINRFTGSAAAGISISGTGGNTIQGNYIGTSSSGGSASANYQGILINGTTGNLIGGTTSSQRNVISGNTWRGIMLAGGTSGNNIRGNYIGVDASGDVRLLTQIGVYLNESPNNTIGGTSAGEGNVVSGNNQIGIYVVYAGSVGNVIQGNTIGLNASRTATAANGTQGVEIIVDASNNTVGGTAAGAANVISGNTGKGVQVRAGTGNAILVNSIHGNGGIGIDLGNDNATANDGAKPAGQPNLQMDFPVFTSVTLSGTTLAVAGYVGSAPSQSIFANARVEIFKSDNDGSGYGEGQTYLGFLTADASGNFSGSLTVAGVSVGDKITGTATDGNNNTSEFGANATVTPIVTLGNGIDPGNAALAPGGAATMADAFTFVASSGTDSITALTVTLSSGSSGGLSLVEITNDAGSTVHGSVANPGSDTPSITLTTPITVTTGSTQYKIRVTPKSHANMPAPAGSSYSVTAYVSDWTGTGPHAGSDSAGTTVTIDNLSPGNVTSSSVAAGNNQNSLSWTNPGDSDLGLVVVLRRAAAAVADVPAEGTTYIVGNTIGSSIVACVVTPPAASCIDAGLTNDTAYHYKIFTRDANGNYATGTVPTGSPATPRGVPIITVTKLSAVLSDPVNGATNPKRIPGAVVEYSITPANSGNGSPDADTVFITDPIDSVTLAVDVGGGVTFVDGATSSGLSLGAVTYSSTPAPGPYVYNYTPVPDGSGYDGNVTSVKIGTVGVFANGGSPAPSFTLKLRVKVK